MKPKKRISYNSLGNKKGNLYLISVFILFLLILVVVGPYFLSLKVETDNIANNLKEDLGAEGDAILDNMTDNYVPWTDRALAIVFLGYWIACLLAAYMAPEHPLLVYVLVFMVVVFAAVGAYMSNVYDDFADDPKYTSARAEYRVTDAILSNYVLWVLLVGFTSAFVYYLSSLRGRQGL